MKFTTIVEGGDVPKLIKQELEEEVYISYKDLEGVAIFSEGIRVDLKNNDSFWVPLPEIENPFTTLEIPYAKPRQASSS